MRSIAKVQPLADRGIRLMSDEEIYRNIDIGAMLWLGKYRKIFIEASRLSPDQADSIRDTWRSMDVLDTPLNKMIFLIRKLDSFVYIKDPERGKIPLPATQTFDTMQGDCKDFAVLAAAMFLALGLEPIIQHQVSTGCGHMLCREKTTGITLEKSDPSNKTPWAQSLACQYFSLDPGKS